ncbi:acetyl-CoA hydrolase/transferase C-terminal domain-containing protein [Parvibaculum sp.]|uniref:acetyl-CoA hydrolase/transferase C-terminal domain-containing protein n=1 Tax=Parvibaculum sp. TaxID=2024848 RepID=UPI0025D8F10E|nr:acetyl-CoA hydrolase/transferase C-terminal domain-containing protein [Parvibaculum sp.]
MTAPARHEDAGKLAETIIAQVGKTIVLALPLGLGKANNIANALFARAVADPSISLTIFTALTLEKPRPSSDLERRFTGPLIDRLFGDYPELAYAKAMHEGRLPANIQVNEFFFLAGRWLGSPLAQQSYISANYTHALRYILDRRVNVVAQLVATGLSDDTYNLSCNTDITLDLLKARAEKKADFIFVGEVNDELPKMPGEAEAAASAFAHILDGHRFSLFAPPKEPIGLSDYAIGLHVAGLVPDGGTLQIGIGSMGDAVAQGLILRHRENGAYRTAMARLATGGAGAREDAPFERGLYGASEMFVDTFLDLMKAGILKREVDGAVLHAGFFLGPKAFYQALRDMPASELAKIRMSPISFINELYGSEEKKRRDRVGARFINSAMMVTLNGAVVSDGLDDGRVVSGVGGQYNFVAQAFALDDARSIITLRSTRESGGKVQSNIRWNYGYTTIPRHLRDVVATEYGIADLRGKTDRDTIVAMLGVADARFQDELLEEARKAGKVEKGFKIPDAFRRNTPAHVASALQPLKTAGLIPPFPFGTDLTETEQRLAPALLMLKAASASPLKLAELLARGAARRTGTAADTACLVRMGLDKPKGAGEHFYAALLRGALARLDAKGS